MNHSDILKIVLPALLPAGGLGRWLVARRRSPAPKPFPLLRLGRWSMQVITASGNLAYTRQLLANAKTALAAQTQDLADAQTEATRLRSENARLRRELASCRGWADGSTPAPTPSRGASAPKRRSRAASATSPASPAGPTSPT